MDKFTIFRELLDYVAHIANVTDADMGFCGDRIFIEGNSDDKVITIDVTIKQKEVKKDD